MKRVSSPLPNITTTPTDAPTSPVSTYQELLIGYERQASNLKKQLGWMSVIRVSLFIAFIYLGYQSIRTGEGGLIFGTLFTLAIFLLFIRLYDKIQQRTDFYTALVKLNRVEIDFLSGAPSTYATAKEYIDPHHDYSYDLDLFGEGGLFAYLNRTSTEFGKEALAQLLLHPQIDNIRERQDAVQELVPMLEFRQHLQAHGSLLDTQERELEQLKAWLAAKPGILGKRLYLALMVLPLTGLGSLIYYLVTENDVFLNGFYFFFVLNLVVAGVFGKEISSQLSVSTSVTKILQQFAGQLQQIERAPFQSRLFKQLQEQLKTGTIPASKSIDKLASLFNYLETIINLVVSLLLNGLFLFHLHILYALEKWKKQNGDLIMPWLRLLGDMESLNSLANLSYNNPSFCHPQLSTVETVNAVSMGHPLIREEKRVNNSIDFSEQKFVILTGSNMSGKSTFLRTLGINLVLARTGADVCAKQFIFYPFQVTVSMRISDSLQDSESFFYAELKRLHHIIEQLEAGEKTFVILDEILRGTNSNDKHSGTVGLIRKLVDARACGIIATHDLTVSQLTNANPTYLSNKCFESEIVDDELIFDYKLKEGVCTRLSASFLMKKMGVID